MVFVCRAGRPDRHRCSHLRNRSIQTSLLFRIGLSLLLTWAQSYGTGVSLGRVLWAEFIPIGVEVLLGLLVLVLLLLLSSRLLLVRAPRGGPREASDRVPSYGGFAWLGGR